MSKKTTEKTAAEHRAEMAKRFHIARIPRGPIYILEIPGIDEQPFQFWSGPFRSERGARVCIDEMLETVAGGEHWMDFPGTAHRFDKIARLMSFLETQNGVDDPRGLARAICDAEDEDVPF
jgi:hypothetical protein